MKKVDLAMKPIKQLELSEYVYWQVQANTKANVIRKISINHAIWAHINLYWR